MPTAFRSLLIFTIVLVGWFILFSENNNNNNNYVRVARAPISSVEEVPRACVNKGQIALTFDEGPSKVTASVLSALASQKIKATFHVVTKYFNNIVVSTNLKTAKENGHVVGLRFPTERDPNAMSDRELKETLIMESFRIHKQIGVYPKFLRLPLGGFTDRVVKIASRLGFIITEWNVDSGDYDKDATRDRIITAFNQQADSVAQGAGRFIALQRDLYAVYDDPAIIATIKANMTTRGYAFVTLDECLSESSGYRADNKDPDGEISDDWAEKNNKSAGSSPIMPLVSLFALVQFLVFLLN